MPTLTRRDVLRATLAIPALAATTSPRPALATPPGPKFLPGLVTYNVARDWDLSTILQVCQKANIAAVECRTTHKHGIEPDLKPDNRKTIRQQFQDAGVVFWGCGSVCEFHSVDANIVKQNVKDCKQFLELVHDIGGRGVKVRPNGVAPGMTPEQACDQIGTALRECGTAAADLGLEIWVEVHGAVTQLPHNMARILAACDHPAVGITWNSNPTDLIDGSIETAFELLKKYIKSCHITNLKSDYPYRDLFARLTAIGYDRYTLCEVPTPVPPGGGAAWLTEYRNQWAALLPG